MSNFHTRVVRNPTTENRQAFLIFAMIVAGKTSEFGTDRTAKLLSWGPNGLSPFRKIGFLDQAGVLEDAMRAVKTGQYKRLGKGLRQVVMLDVDRCPKKDLLSIHGIGPKTASYFLTYARDESGHAVLDTHVLRFLRECGVDAPEGTPPVGEEYERLAREFTSRAHAADLTTQELDNFVWRYYARQEEVGMDRIFQVLSDKDLAA